ncbi:hypothetical protein MKQ68_21665 [Chitinophaga horti]|uniref:DUF4199 domain-containing protein n=1 Tax=Chitinophaga horti TaxID=2920382 RepID=A0ABY6IZ87_9BACT|nr:hypothetical protein [Chitinophaga horti]UYQ92690.1 hypothetical protein MKQ68_21665 [Chitinophaga horti]
MQTIHHSQPRLTPIYGISIAVISIVFTIIFYLTSQFDNLWTGYFVHLIMFLGVLFSVIHFNKVKGGGASIPSLVKMGLHTATWAIIIVSAFTIIFHLAVEPLGSGGVPSDGNTISDTSPYKKQGFWIFLVSNVLFVNGILGLLASVLGAISVKRNQKTEKRT